MSMSDLVAAGAPELPAGYFYRVKSFLPGVVQVQVRRALPVLGSVCEADGLVWADERRTALDVAALGCHRAHRDWERQRQYREVRRLFGDHDPRGDR